MRHVLMLALVASLAVAAAGQAADTVRPAASSAAEAAVEALEARRAAGGSAAAKTVARKTKAGGVKMVAPCSDLDKVETILPVSCFVRGQLAVAAMGGEVQAEKAFPARSLIAGRVPLPSRAPSRSRSRAVI
jgi:hypothetical protein